MHGVVGRSQGNISSNSSEVAKLREALALAREQLVRAVGDRGAETVLTPDRGSSRSQKAGARRRSTGCLAQGRGRHA